MEFLRKDSLLHKLVIVDGVGKCGKSLLCQIITAFSVVEKYEFNGPIEFIAMAHKHNKISSDVAIAILKTEIDTSLYNLMIGRYVNTRLTDDTSVYKYHNPAKYLKRSLDSDGPIIAERVLKEKPVSLYWTHDLINKADIVFEAFRDKLEFFYVNRRPIDIIYEWNIVNYSARMANDPTEMQYTIKHKNTTVPLVALGWEDEFLSISSYERTVKIIHSFFKLNYQSLLEKHNRLPIHIINFEELVENPSVVVDKLKIIMNDNPLPVLEQILSLAKCPRVISEKVMMDREAEIIKNISQRYRDVLQETKEIYENIKRLSRKS